MTVLFDLTHETGNLSQYTASSTDSGDLSVAAGAALVGSYGLSVLIDDSNAIYGQYGGLASATGIARLRAYVDPNGLTMATNDEFVWLRIYNTALSPLVELWLGRSATSYRVQLGYTTDAGQSYTAYWDITDAPHYIEFDYRKASTNVSSNGTFTVYLDGSLVASYTTLDNYDVFTAFERLRVGMVASRDAGTSGTFYVDEIKANDDGGAIGPAGGSATITGAAVLAGSGSAQGAPLNIVQAVAALSGQGNSGGASLLQILAQATAAGAGQAQGAGLLIIPAGASLDGSAQLSGTSILAVAGAAALQGAGVLQSAALLLIPASGSLTGAADLTGSAILIIPGAGQLAGSGLLTADGVNLGALVVGAAQLAGSANLTGAPAVRVMGTATLTGLAGLEGDATLLVLGAGELSGAGAADGDALLIIRAASALLGSGVLQAAGRIPILTVITPDGRMFVVPVDVRRYFVPAEDRAFTVDAEDRVYIVPA